MSGQIPRGHKIRLDPPPRLILFDLDDTLCDHSASLAARLHHSFEPIFSDVELRERVVRRSAELSWEGTDHFSELFTEFGVVEPEAPARAHERYVSDRYLGLELFDDTLPVLQQVRESTTIGIITNGPTDIQQPKLDLLEIEPLFSFVLISESVGIWKPDPGIFQLALELGNASADETIYIGDSVEADVPGAHAAGIGAIWMNRLGKRWPGGQEPHVEIHDLYELLQALGLDG